MRLTTASSKPPLPKSRHVPFIVAGAAAFLGINTVLFLEGCTSTELMFNCSGGIGTHTYDVLIIGCLVGLGAVISRRGRSVAIGFCGALITLGVVSLGACTAPWADPYFTVRQRVEPYRLRWARDRKNAAMRRDWISSMNARAMDVSRGVDLAGVVVECAQAFRAAEGRVATNDDELSDRCTFLKDLRASSDPDPPVRYIVPVARGENAQGEPIRDVPGDAGWRVTYTAAPSGFSVDVAPDAQLTHKWPRIHADGISRFDVQVSADVPPMPVTPVADLLTMVGCLKGILAEEDRRKAERGGLNYGWHLTSLARRLCPDLSPRLNPLLPTDESATLLSVFLPVGPDKASVIVAVYKVRFLLRDPARAPFAYDLLANATSPGLPHYLATFEGSVHWTIELRSATVRDPRAK